MLSRTPSLEKFDVVVIGGGSGGLSFCKELGGKDASIAVFDFVEPSPHGHTWGLGGTCVNVGCIPKKLFHTAALIKSTQEIAVDYGFSRSKKINFAKLSENIQSYIKSLNFGYRTMLNSNQVKYFNELAAFYDPETLISSKDPQLIRRFLAGDKIDGAQFRLTKFNQALIAVGGRPSEMSFPGSKHMISSDDIFFLRELPRNVAVIGGGYIAHECASYLRHLGSKVTMLTRGKFMRVFDSQVSARLRVLMENDGIEFIENATPIELIKNDHDKKMTLNFDQKTPQGSKKLKLSELDLVLSAVSRHASCDKLNLHRAFQNAIKVNDKGQVVGGFKGETERLSDRLYAVGDCLQGTPELTPVAIRAGKEVAARVRDRLAGKEDKYPPIDYSLYPSTVFTSPEYSYCGLSEDDARKKFGNENVICFHRESPILEKSLSSVSKNAYFKIVCLKNQNLKVVGMHYLGPNAGEIMQGYYLAVALGLTKSQLDSSFGIHPTVAENFIDLNKTSDDADLEKTAC